MSRYALSVTTVLLAAACSAACVSGVGAPPPAGFGRVDQVGYRTDEVKQAFVMGPSDDTSFRVVDESGRTVLVGAAGPSTGAWNAEFTTVRALDFSALKTPGRYRILAAGAAPSPVFRIGSGAELFGVQVTANVHFFPAQRDGVDVVASTMDRKPAHLNDATATVYEVPRYDQAGKELREPGTRIGQRQLLLRVVQQVDQSQVIINGCSRRRIIVMRHQQPQAVGGE